MSVKVREKKPGEFWVFVNHGGQRRCRKIGRDRSIAEAAAAELEGQIALDMGLSSVRARAATARAALSAKVNMESDSRGRTRQHTGAAGELLVAADLLRLGFDVFRNFASAGIDLVAALDGRFYSVEVKVCERVRQRDGRMTTRTLRDWQRECDVVALVHAASGAVQYEPSDWAERERVA